MTKLEEFLTADYDKQFALVAEPETKVEVEAWMGREAFQEFLEHRPAPGHLSAGAMNIVFVPGVMGSTLQSDGFGGVWWLDMMRARKQVDQLGLRADGGGDADNKAQIKAGTIDVAYVPFRRAIASSDDFGGSVHYPFDWRKSMRASADGLRDTILKTYEEYSEPVHLVGHSMGGLVIRTALMTHGAKLWSKVGRIVFIGTPHYGSPSIAGYLKNHLWGWEELAIVGMFLSRETFRSMRGVIELLPAPEMVYPGTRNGEKHPCANFEMYDASAWKLDLDASATIRFQSALDGARKLHTDLYQWHQALPQQEKDRMLMIAGVGEETLFRLEFDQAFWGLWKQTKKVTDRIPCDPDRDGDGRVPLRSAELEDVTTRYVKGSHGGLPNIPTVAREVLAWLTGEKLRLAETCEGALKGHLSAEEAASVAPLLDGSAVARRFRDLPEYEEPTPEFRTQIEAELDSGKLPHVNLVKIL
jgi:pimeloyl-ACP methyl ester carboxylesterase